MIIIRVMSSQSGKKKGAKGKGKKKVVSLGMEVNIDEVEETHFNEAPPQVAEDEFKIIQAVHVKEEMSEEVILEREKDIVRQAPQ